MKKDPLSLSSRRSVEVSIHFLTSSFSNLGILNYGKETKLGLTFLVSGHANFTDPTS